jgi:hypothetical protein
VTDEIAGMPLRRWYLATVSADLVAIKATFATH